MKLLALLLVLATPALGQSLGPEAPADRRYQRGIKLFEEGRFALAAQEFRVALELLPGSARLVYNLARSLESAGQLERAIETYQLYLRLAPKAGDRADVEGFVRALGKELERQRGAVLVSTEPEGAEVFVDEDGSAGRAPLSLRLAPGRHVLRLEAEGHRSEVREVQVEAGGSSAVSVTLAPVPAPDPEPEVVAVADPGMSARDLAGWSLLGAGVALGAVGGVFYAVSAETAEEGDAEGIARSRHTALESDFSTQQALAWTGFGLGAALLATGTTLLLLPADETLTLRPALGGGSLQVRW